MSVLAFTTALFLQPDRKTVSIPKTLIRLQAVLNPNQAFGIRLKRMKRTSDPDFIQKPKFVFSISNTIIRNS